jgi:hypothetical protein
MPKAFSQSSIIFDGPPDDSQLVCLLGHGGGGPLQAVEEAQMLTLRPKMIPLKVLAPWIVLIMAGMTCMICFMPWGAGDRLSSVFFWFFLAFGWLVVLPGMLAVFAIVNRMMARHGDYVQLDSAHRTLEVRRLGRTFAAGEVLAVTLLTRWYHSDILYQTGILVRTPDHRVEFCRVVCESSEDVPSCAKSRWADRLASVFQVPVRTQELSPSESHKLDDYQCSVSRS